MWSGVRAELVLNALERKLGQSSSAAAAHEYLQSRVQYDPSGSERLMDPEDRAVMMAWEGYVPPTKMSRTAWGRF